MQSSYATERLRESDLKARPPSALSALRAVVLGATAAVGTVGIASNAGGAFVDSLPTYDPPMRTAGLSFAGRVVWLQGKNTSLQTYYTQGVLLPDGKRVLTSGHVIPSGTGISTLDLVGNGTHFLTDRGAVVEVQSWVKNADYDLAVVTLKNALPAVPMTPGTGFFAAPVAGANYSIAGFGPVADPTTASSYTGDIRAFSMKASGDSVAPYGYSDSAFFLLETAASTGNAYAVSGDSSSIIFNAENQVVGIMKAGGTGFNIANRFTDPGVLQFVNVPEPSALALLAAAGAGLLRRRRARRIAACVVGLTVGVGALPKAADAALMPDGSNDALYKAYGSSFQGDLLQFRIKVPGVGSGKRDASAVFLNSQYALTAAHNVDDLLQYHPTFEVASGDNFNTNRGLITAVESVVLYPGYDGTLNTPDLALIRFANPILGENANGIGSASAGDVLTEAGFGASGTPSGGVSSTRDGFSRAWQAKVSNQDPVAASSTFYQSTYFGTELDGVTLNGKGLSGDSGGLLFNQTGELIGLVIAETGGTAGVGTTISLKLSQSDVNAWIQANSVVPEPSSLGLLAAAGAGLLRRRRTRR